jgi:hypothetical protein
LPGENNGDEQGGVMLPGQTKSGTITVGDFDLYKFNATIGDKVTIQMSDGPGSALTPLIRLFSPDGTKLSQASDFPALIESYTLPTTGTYTILCSDDDGQSTGGYALSIALFPGPNNGDEEGGAIQSGQNRSGTITVGDFDLYNFNGTTGAKVTIRMSNGPGSALTPLIRLFGPDGTKLSQASDFPALIESFPLPVDGTYTILCSDDDGQSQGTYGLSFTSICGDSDQDGLCDDWEKKYFGDLRYSGSDDPDNDGLKNQNEQDKLTDPTKADTDGDGFTDGEEVTWGSDPLNAQSGPIPLTISVASINLCFDTVKDKKYQLYGASDPAPANWTLLQPVTGTGSPYCTNIVITGTEFRFYKVKGLP